jgi:uncharacterized membrane protein YkoI
MRIAKLGLGLAMASAALAGCAHAKSDRGGAAHDESADEQELDVRDVAGEAHVTLLQAIRTAHAAQPGKVVEAELEGEIEKGVRSVAYEVMVVDGDRVLEVKVDPASGKVVSVEPEAEAKEIAELKALAASIPAGTQGLGDFVVRAEKSAPHAQSVKAEFEVEDGRLNCEVVMLRDGKRIELDVDPVHRDVPPVEEKAEHEEKPSGAKAKHHEKDDDDDDDDDDEDEHGK